MSLYKMSINQIADFSEASEAKKRQLIKQQQNPNKFLIPWYQLAKARMRKSLANKGDLRPVYDAIETLINRVPENNRQEIDKRVSQEALDRFIKMNISKLLGKYEYQSFKPEQKSVIISGVEIIIAPDVVIRAEIEGQTYLGGVKLHLAKGNQFNLHKSRIVSFLVYKYLLTIASDGEKVLPELCFSIDIFAGRIMPSDKEDSDLLNQELRELCEEIKYLWNDV